ncbi:MAG: PD-(D/E)XK nuclease family protein [Clostridia bacterium]|nr:PD-(D/E)XK nuclease family protein [Clostridia bacterium]
MSVFTSKTYFDCIQGAVEKATSFGVSLSSRVVLFCEDKFALSLEKALVLKAGGAFGAEVLSFGRYISKVFAGRKTLSKEGSAMAIKKILSEQRTNLKVLGGMSHSPSLAVKTAELIAQLKSAKVTPADLFNCLDGCPLSVSSKLFDIATVYQGYENFLLEKGLTDSSNSLSDMLVALERDESITSAHVILVGYSSVTKQSCEIMKKLLSVCKSCDFFTVSGNNTDLYTNEFVSFVTRLTSQAPIPTSSTLISEAEVILDRLFDPESFEKAGIYSDKVRVFEGKSILDEVEYVCSQIKKKIVADGYRYSDIAIGVGNLEAYSLLLKRKLADFDIPYFADEKRSLYSHPLCQLITHLLKASQRKDLSEIKRVIRSSLFMPEKELSDKLLRLMTENAVTAHSFIFGDDFIPFSKDGGENFDNEVLRSKRNAISTFILNFPKRASAKTYADIIEGFALSTVGDEEDLSSPLYRLAKKLEQMGAEEEKTFLLSGIKGFTAVLDEIRNILGDESLSGEELLKILISGEEASEVSLIPEYYDSVYLSEIKNLRFEKYPCLFIMGLSGDVPPIKADTALLLDSDIARLESLAVSVEPKIRVVNNREKEATALAFACFEDELNLSFSLTTAEGKATVRSEILDYIENAFSSKEKRLTVINRLSLEKELDTQAEEDVRQSLPYMSLRPAMLSMLSEGDDYKNGAISDLTGASSFFEALKKFDNQENIATARALVDNVNGDVKVKIDFPSSNCFAKGNVSASFVEAYYSCPYKCFLKYGVGVKDTLSAEIRSLDFGNILHNVAELFTPYISQVKTEDDCKKIANELTDKIFEDEKYSRFLKRPDFAYSSLLTKKEAEKLCVELFRQNKNSRFQTVGNEVWLARLPLLSKKGLYHLVGKVDRVDKYKNYVRIIDYKTGNAKNKSSENNFYAGQNLQLYLYLNAFALNGDKPAGAYYYAVNDDFKKEDDVPSVMYGKTLDDEEIICASDESFYSGDTERSSAFEIKRKVTKKGVSYEGKLADEKTMNAYMKYAKLMTTKAIDDVLDGVIIPSPYEKTCDYCEFGGICGRDKDKKSGYRSVKGVKTEHIIKAVEQAEKNGGDGDGN